MDLMSLKFKPKKNKRSTFKIPLLNIDVLLFELKNIKFFMFIFLIQMLKWKTVIM